MIFKLSFWELAKKQNPEMDWFSNRCYFGNMETTLKDRFLEYFAFFLAAQYNLSLCPSNGLPASRPTLWALHCMVQRASSLSLHPIFQLLFYLFPAHVTAHKQPSSLPALSSGQSQCLGTSQSLLFHLSLLLPQWHLLGSAIRTEKPVCSAWCWCAVPQLWGQETSSPGGKCQVRQKCRHHLGSQEDSGRTRHLALWPDSYRNQHVSTDCLISMEPVFSDVRTTLSVIPFCSNHLWFWDKFNEVL